MNSIKVSFADVESILCAQPAYCDMSAAQRELFVRLAGKLYSAKKRKPTKPNLQTGQLWWTVDGRDLKVNAIKFVRSYTGKGLYDAKQHVETGDSFLATVQQVTNALRSFGEVTSVSEFSTGTELGLAIYVSVDNAFTANRTMVLHGFTTKPATRAAS